MHHSNPFYGQAHIFSRYCGLDGEPQRIWGTLQHGWNPLHGHGFAKGRIPAGFVNFVWSDAARRRGQSIGWRDYFAIGSAWAYLLRLQPPPPPDSQREGTIFYPFHGAEIGPVIGDHLGLIREIQETESEPVTACLYWFEYDQPEIRSLYEHAGFRVICHGARGTRGKGTDVNFLYRQYDELVKHKRVASNRLSTAVFYGGSVGCDVAVYGDPMRYEGKQPHHERKEHVRRLLPELHGAQTDRGTVQEIVITELGMDRVAPAQEVKELFGWRQR